MGTQPPPSQLGAIAGALRPLLPELAAVLPPQPQALGDPRAERHRIFRALRELLAALGPTVCVLEDLHWADESTLDFLAFLVADAPRELALVLTYRTTDLPAASALPGLVAGLLANVRHATVGVPPLSVDEVGRLCGTLLGVDTVSDELAEHLHEQTAGLPFAVEELVRLHHGALERVDGWRTVDELDHVGVPAAVSQALRERMTALTKDAWLVTRAAAVLAEPAGEELVGRVAGLSSVRATRALSRALSAAVLEERADGRYGFLHALAAQAVYDEIPGPERRWLHRRAAEALRSQSEPTPPAQLAHHFRHAGLWRPWTRHAEAAADAACSIGDDRSAARLLEQALGAPQLSRAARLRMARKLGTAALYSAHPERAMALLQRIRDEEPMPIAVRGELRAVERDLAWLQRAVDAAARSGDPAVRAGVAGQRAAILLSVGDPEGWTAAAAIPRDGRRIDQRLTLLWSLQSLATICIGLGHCERAEACLREVAGLLDELAHVAWGPWLQSARASLDWRTGNWDGLEARLRSLTDGGSGGPALAIGNEMILASLLLSHNRVRDAEQLLRSIRARGRARGWMGRESARPPAWHGSSWRADIPMRRSTRRRTGWRCSSASASGSGGASSSRWPCRRSWRAAIRMRPGRSRSASRPGPKGATRRPPRPRAASARAR